MPTTHEIERREDALYLMGEMLIHFYPSGDVDTPTEKCEGLYRALYDHHQCNYGLDDGDAISLDGEVVAYVDDVHVIAVSEVEPAKLAEWRKEKGWTE